MLLINVYFEYFIKTHYSLTSNRLSKFWNSNILAWKPSARAPPETGSQKKRYSVNRITFPKPFMITHSITFPGLQRPYGPRQIHTDYHPHLLQAFLEPSAHEPAGPPWQRRRRCGRWPGPGPPRPAHPPGSWCSGPCAACGPDTATTHFIVKQKGTQLFTDGAVGCSSVREVLRQPLHHPAPEPESSPNTDRLPHLQFLITLTCTFLDSGRKPTQAQREHENTT